MVFMGFWRFFRGFYRFRGGFGCFLRSFVAVFLVILLRLVGVRCESDMYGSCDPSRTNRVVYRPLYVARVSSSFHVRHINNVVHRFFHQRHPFGTGHLVNASKLWASWFFFIATVIAGDISSKCAAVRGERGSSGLVTGGFGVINVRVVFFSRNSRGACLGGVSPGGGWRPGLFSPRFGANRYAVR